MELFSLFPLTFTVDRIEGANGRNWPTHIVIKRSYLQAAIYAQERWEWPRFIHRLFAPIRCQIFSHEVEVQAAAIVCGQDEHAYRRQEANLMMDYDYLYPLGVDEIESRMKAQREKARKWVLSMRKTLERMRIS